MMPIIATLQLPQPIMREEARRIFLRTASKYRGLPGLIGKYCLLSEDGRTAGGVYLWNLKLWHGCCVLRLRAAAQGGLVIPREVAESTSALPLLSCVDTFDFNIPVVVDNITNEILTDE